MSAAICLCTLPINGYAQNSIFELKEQVKKGDLSSASLIAISEHHIQKEQNSDSIFKYTRLLKRQATQSKDSLLFGETYLQFAHGHYLNSSYDSVFHYGKKAIRIFDRLDQKGRRASAEILFGNTHRILFENKEALGYLKQALPHAKDIDRVMVQIGLATVNIQLNNLEEASLRYNEAFRISKEINNDLYLYNIHNGLATVYLKGEKFDEVLDSLLKALAIAEEQANYVGQAKCLHNIAHYYNGEEEYSKAETYLKKAIELFPKINSEYLKASVYRLYAESLTELGSIEEASYYLDKAEVIYRSRIPARLGLINSLRANIALKSNRPQQAIKLLEEGIAVSKKNKLMGNLQANYLQLSEVQQKVGNTRAALDAYKNHKAYQDSVAQRNKTKEIEALKLQFDIAQYEQEIIVKDQKLALLDSQKKTGNYRNLLLGFITLGLLFFVYRQRKINKINKAAFNTEKELSILKEAQIIHGKKEITEYAIHINEHNKLMDACLTRIKTLKRKASEPIVKSGLTDLQFYIKDNLDINKEKIELDSKVQSEQEDFTFNLKRQYPELSQKEIQVATYLVLNLSSKQAASQMGIKDQSVYNYRLSLRKKLKIRKETNLSEFLRQL